MNQNLKIGIIILIVLVALSFLITLLFTSNIGSLLTSPNTARIADIKISGELLTETQSSIFAPAGLSSADIAGLIKKADEDKSIDGVLLDINSPGGTIVASEEIGNAVKNLSKPSVAYIKELGASGGYWVASASDWIVADKYATTGSIGVIGSYLSFDGLLKRYNVTYQRLVGGKYKDVGSPYTNLTADERKELQLKIDYLHKEFINEVAVNRNLSYSYVEQFATGMFYLGDEAYKIGLIDEVGSKEDAKNYLKQALGKTNVTLITFSKEPSLFEAFSQLMSKSFLFVGKGISQGFIEAESKSGFKV